MSAAPTRPTRALLLLLLLVGFALLELLTQRLPALHRIPSHRGPDVPTVAPTVPPIDEAIRSSAEHVAAAHGGELLLAFVHNAKPEETSNFLEQLRAARLLPALLAIALDQPSLSLLRAMRAKHGAPAAGGAQRAQRHR